MILPIIGLIPLIPADVRAKANDVLTKMNAIPTIEEMMQAKSDLTALRTQY